MANKINQGQSVTEHTHYLTCKSVYFYSPLDEAIFFEWIQRIPCIEKFEAAGDELYLDLINRELSYHDIKDLIALFYRFNIDMQQLGPLKNNGNKNAFEPWHKKIFEDSLRKKQSIKKLK